MKKSAEDAAHERTEQPKILSKYIRAITVHELRDIANMVIAGNFAEVEKYAADKRAPLTRYVIANAIQGAVKRKEFHTFDAILNRLIGRASAAPPEAGVQKEFQILDFPEFCESVGYPKPFPKQIEMKEFGLEGKAARLLLGARGYGKTDYVVICGLAHRIYLNFISGNEPDFSVLLVTKSIERNSAILDEIAKACEVRGVVFEKKTASVLRVQGAVGKEHTVSALTLGAASFRGRHPKLVIMDDPVTEEDTSEATRRRVQKIYNELWKLCSNILIIGQPVHKADLYATLRPLVAKLEVPYGSIAELDCDLEAQRLAGVSEESIQASYFLNVISEEGSPFSKVQWLDRFPASGSAVAFIDPSFEGGDYTALTMLKGHFDGIAVKGHVYKRAWYDCLPQMAEAMVSAGVARVCIETNCLGNQPVYDLRTALSKTAIGVAGKKSTNNKHSRIMNAGAYAEKIFLCKDSDKKYIEHVTQYEYGAEYDDAPDSLASCMEWVGLVRGK